MTIPEQIILRNADQGITFYRSGASLKWDPPVRFTPEQLACIKRYESGILAHVDASEADEVLSLLELPCGRLGLHETNAFSITKRVHANESNPRSKTATEIHGVPAAAGDANSQRCSEAACRDPDDVLRRTKTGQHVAVTRRLTT